MPEHVGHCPGSGVGVPKDGADGVNEAASCSSDEPEAGLTEVAHSEAAAARAALVRAEVARILAAPPGRPMEILGLTANAGLAPQDVRHAYRRIALLVHPDKNPDFEASCKEALLRAQEARVTLEMRGKAMSDAKVPPHRPTPQGESSRHNAEGEVPRAEQRARRRRTAARRRPRSASRGSCSGPEHLEQRPREAFASPEGFVVHALQHCLARWRQSALEVWAAEHLGDGGRSVLHSRAVFRETAAAVSALCQLLEAGALGPSIVEKLERMCCHLMAREYVPASQAYLDLSIGSRTWHGDVPSLLEAGCTWGGRKAGVERGRLFKQARTAQRLNSERASSATVLDDDTVKLQLTSLKRLLTVAQELHPNEDPSRNCL